MNAITELNRAREAYRRALHDAYIAIPDALKALGESVQPPTPSPTPKPTTAAPAKSSARKPWVRVKHSPAEVAEVIDRVRAVMHSDTWQTSRSVAASLALPASLVKAACEALVHRGEAKHRPNGAHPEFCLLGGGQ